MLRWPNDPIRYVFMAAVLVAPLRGAAAQPPPDPALSAIFVVNSQKWGTNELQRLDSGLTVTATAALGGRYSSAAYLTTYDAVYVVTHLYDGSTSSSRLRRAPAPTMALMDLGEIAHATPQLDNSQAGMVTGVTVPNHIVVPAVEGDVNKLIVINLDTGVRSTIAAPTAWGIGDTLLADGSSNVLIRCSVDAVAGTFKLYKVNLATGAITDLTPSGFGRNPWHPTAPGGGGVDLIVDATTNIATLFQRNGEWTKVSLETGNVTGSGVLTIPGIGATRFVGQVAYSEVTSRVTVVATGSPASDRITTFDTNLTEVGHFDVADRRVRDLRHSPDGTQIVVLFGDKAMGVYQLPNGAQVALKENAVKGGRIVGVKD
jgi:hypothetical protein